MSEGWRCPSCGQVWAPWMIRCQSCPQMHSTGSGTIQLHASPECEHEWFADTGGTRCAKCGKRTSLSDYRETTCADGPSGEAQ